MDRILDVIVDHKVVIWLGFRGRLVGWLQVGWLVDGWLVDSFCLQTENFE